MKTDSTFSILFWIKKSRLKNGKAPIYARLTASVPKSAKREVSVFNWILEPKWLREKPSTPRRSITTFTA